MTEADRQIDAASQALNEGRREDALRLLLPLAEAGNARAQFGLGVLYSVGHAHEFDKEKAIHWHERALSNEMPFAAYQLGELLNPELKRVWDHFNVPPFDAVKSNSFYAKAAVDLTPLAIQGDTRAAAILAELYLFGHGVTADPNAAAYWHSMTGAGTETSTKR